MSATEATGGAGADRPQPAFHMTPDELRSLGAAVIDWVATYHENIESFPVQSRVEPGDIRRLMPAHAPEQPESFADVFADLERVVVPGLTHWQSPNFFAYFPANTSGPSILGELVSAGLGVQGMSWATSPAATEVETHVLDWLVELLGLPERFLSSGPGGGVIQHSASDATLCAILARPHRAGVEDLSTLRAYTSTQAHSSVEKGIRIAGLGADQLRLIDVDAAFAMDVDA